MTEEATFAALRARHNVDAENGRRDPADARMRVSVRTIADYETLDVDYLEGFEGFIPKGMPSCIAGEPGLGKSSLNAYICVAQARLGLVTVLAVAEDSVQHIVRPRLQAAGLKPEQYHLVKIIGLANALGEEGQLRLPDHAEQLLEAIDGLAAAGETPVWLNLDPVGAYLGRGIDNSKDQDVRAAVEPLDTICRKHGTAVTLTAHLNKSTGVTLQERLANSAAFYQWPRSVMLLARDPEDPEKERGDLRVLSSDKLNVDRKPVAHGYRIAATSVVAPRTRSGYREANYLIRNGTSTYTPTQLLTASRRPAGKDAPRRNACETFLLEFLENGPVPYTEVLAEAERRDITKTTLHHAATALGLERPKQGMAGGTTWRLPAD